VRQIGSRRWLRVDHRDGARAIQPEGQKARKTVISADSKRATLCPREPSFGDEIIEKACSPKL
jgi:hypothetical protein